MNTRGIEIGIALSIIILLFCLNWQKKTMIYLISANDDPIVLKCYSTQGRIYFDDTLKQELFLQSKFLYDSSEPRFMEMEIRIGNNVLDYKVRLFPLVYRHVILLFFMDESGKIKVKTERRFMKPIFQ